MKHKTLNLKANNNKLIFFFRLFRWRFEALKSRCVIMNREMLLENNSISFDRKLQNIRQMVEKKFGPNEEPMIDDVVCSVDESSTKNICASETNDLSVNEPTESWSDVEEIFANINGRLPTAENTSKGKRYKNLSQADNTIIMLPDEKDIPREQNSIFSTNNTDSMNECVKGIKTNEATEPIENKENINHLSEKMPTNTIGLSPEKANETVSSNFCPSKFTDKSEHNCTQDSQNRVRQVNVEMFTVTLKRRENVEK